MMTEKQIKRATQTYNNIMYSLARDENTCGENGTGEGTENWNIRDMICEIDYTLQIFLDENCMPYMDAHAFDPTFNNKRNRNAPYYTEWYNPIQRMKKVFENLRTVKQRY